MALCLTILMLFSLISPTLSMAASEKPVDPSGGYVTVTVEKFTLGQGYILEPILVPFDEGDNVAKVITKVLGSGNYRNTGRPESSFYLSQVYDPNPGDVNIPSYIMDKIGSEFGRYEPDWLGEFDYSFMSGWMYAVNNIFPNVGASDTKVKNGDVIRWQFTVYGFGEDLGSSFDGSGGIISPAHKDALTEKIAIINSHPNKQELLSNESMRIAYGDAYKALTTMESSQSEVDAALEAVLAAYDALNRDVTEVDKIELLAAFEAAQQLKDSLSVSVDGEDVAKTHYWVLEEQLQTLVAVIEAAQELLANEDATQAEVDAKVLALNQTIADIQAVKQLGTKNNLLDVTEELNKHLSYLVETVDEPTLGTAGGEWTVLALARGNYDVPEGYYDTYYNNIVKEVERLMPETARKPAGRLDANRGTEHSRLMLGLTAIGKDIYDVAGYDIRAALADFTYVTRQGINGPIFGLIAFDSKQYEVPVDPNVTNQTTRAKMLDYILEREKSGGGWSLSGPADPDITEMAMQALVPYYDENEDVKAAVDRALAWLSDVQNDQGGFASWGVENVQSVAQVVVALTSLGLDPHTDERFIKNGHSAMDNLLTYAVPTGGFVHPKGGSVDWMATDQGTYALVAYDRFMKGKTSLYDMTDVSNGEDEPSTIVPLPTENGQPLEIPNDGKEYTIRVGESDQNKIVEIILPENTETKTFIEFPANVPLPQLSVARGAIAVEFLQGIMMTEESAALELITVKNENDELRTNLGSLLPSNRELETIYHVFTMGGNESIYFSDYVEITFEGKAGKEAAFIQSGEVTSIQKFSSNQDGLTSGKDEYAYENGNDLIVKTKHFTDFVVYSTKAKSGNGDTGGSAPGSGSDAPPFTSTIVLSIDKQTINKGYVLSPTTVTFTPGESVWDVVKREMDRRGIAYEYSYSDRYESVYVESIAGDGEFDHGSGSGWMYNVNGTYPNYGASKYTLQNGDRVQWRYTTNLGADLGQDLAQWEGTSPQTGGNTPPTTKESIPLKDVYSDAKDISSWAYGLVQDATERGFVDGYNKKFHPKKEITRAEFAKLVVSMFDIALETNIANPFTDVKADDWFYPYVKAASANGIIYGYDNKFFPGEAITREEMAVMIARILDLHAIPSSVVYKDGNDISSWAKTYVESISALKLMTGYGDAFHPKANVTREMAIVVAMRAFDYREKR